MDLKSLLSPKPEEVELEEVKSEPKKEKLKVQKLIGFTKNSNSGYQFGNKLLRKNKFGFFMPSDEAEHLFFKQLAEKGELKEVFEE